MKMRLGALRALVEAAVDPGSAGKQGLAIFVSDMDFYTSVIAYDPVKLFDNVLQGIEEGEAPDVSLEKNGTGAIVGIVSMKPASPGDEGNCYGSYVIQGTAARKGYGPLIYDMALALGRPVIPDRRSVSKFARGVWDKYMARGDVKKAPLDDKDNPKTPDKRDDCKVFKDSESLNYAFSRHGGGTYSGMLSNDKKAFADFNAELKKRSAKEIDYVTWKSGITLAASDYFAIRYASDVIHAR